MTLAIIFPISHRALMIIQLLFFFFGLVLSTDSRSKSTTFYTIQLSIDLFHSYKLVQITGIRLICESNNNYRFLKTVQFVSFEKQKIYIGCVSITKFLCAKLWHFDTHRLILFHHFQIIEMVIRDAFRADETLLFNLWI